MDDATRRGTAIRFRAAVRTHPMPTSPTAASGTASWRTERLLAAVAAAAVLVLGPGAGAAKAHDTLVGSAPTAGAAVKSPPSSVAIEFSDVPQALGTQVVVIGPDGAPVSDGDTEQDGTTIRQPLSGELPAGGYAVQWRVISADGHPLSGTFGFTVDQGTGAERSDAAAGSSASTRMDTAGSITDPGASSFPVVWIAVGAILVVGVGVVVRQLRRPA
jgi:copper resistance protein C